MLRYSLRQSVLRELHGLEGCRTSSYPSSIPLSSKSSRRCIHVLLRREGWRVNAKRVYRLYREMGLQLRNKTPERRIKAKLREDRQLAARPNETWAMDFVHDQLATGRKCGCLRSLTRSLASRRRSNLGSTSAALLLWR